MKKQYHTKYNLNNSVMIIKIVNLFQNFEFF